MEKRDYQAYGMHTAFSGGSVTLTRLADGATRHIQDEEAVSFVKAYDALPSSYSHPAALNALCGPYFEDEGLWEVQEASSHPGLVIKPVPGQIVADVDGRTEEDWEAARKMAAAPELLQACKVAARVLADYDESEGDEGEVYRQLTRAINKAEGRRDE